MSENSYIRDLSAQVSQIPFLTLFETSRLITTVWPGISENSYLRDFNAKVSQIVFLANLRILRLLLNCMTWNVKKLIAPRFQCTSITKRFPRLFDRFTAFYNCMSLNIRKLVSAASVHKYRKSCSHLIWPFYSLLQLYDLKCQKTLISASSVHKYHKSFS